MLGFPGSPDSAAGISELSIKKKKKIGILESKISLPLSGLLLLKGRKLPAELDRGCFLGPQLAVDGGLDGGASQIFAT